MLARNQLALKKTKYEHLENLFAGPTAIGSSEDSILPAKILVNFSKYKPIDAMLLGHLWLHWLET